MVHTIYRIYVKGQIRGMVSDDYIKHYETNVKPATYEAARSLVDSDFIRVTELHCEEITTTTTLLHLEREND